MPLCTSSAISKAPCWWDALRRVCRNPADRSNAPATPWTGSTITAATSGPIIASAAAQSSRGMKSTSKGFLGKPYHLSEFHVTAPAAAVRPWKPCVTASTLLRCVTVQAMRNAFSLASAPELTKNTRSSESGATDRSFSAAPARTSSATALLWNNRVSDCSLIAATSRACP